MFDLPFLRTQCPPLKQKGFSSSSLPLLIVSHRPACRLPVTNSSWNSELTFLTHVRLFRRKKRGKYTHSSCFSFLNSQETCEEMSVSKAAAPAVGERASLTWRNSTSSNNMGSSSHSSSSRPQPAWRRGQHRTFTPRYHISGRRTIDSSHNNSSNNSSSNSSSSNNSNRK